MKLIDAQMQLDKFGQTFLQTSDVAAILKIQNAHASKIMTRLSESGFVTKLIKGKWAITKQIDPFLVPEFIVAPELSYISLQSALFYHGMISQIPETIYAVSTTKTQKYKTSIGTFSIHHLDPEFFFGFESVGNHLIKMAIPEKALLDYFYFSPTRSLIFHGLPEIELPKKFNKKLALDMINKIQSKSRRTIVKKLFQKYVLAL